MENVNVRNIKLTVNLKCKTFTEIEFTDKKIRKFH